MQHCPVVLYTITYNSTLPCGAVYYYLQCHIALWCCILSLTMPHCPVVLYTITYNATLPCGAVYCHWQCRIACGTLYCHLLAMPHCPVVLYTVTGNATLPFGAVYCHLLAMPHYPVVLYTVTYWQCRITLWCCILSLTGNAAKPHTHTHKQLGTISPSCHNTMPHSIQVAK